MTQSLFILFFAMPLTVFVALVCAPDWLVNVFVRLGWIEDCTRQTQTRNWKMRPRPRKGDR